MATSKRPTAQLVVTTMNAGNCDVRGVLWLLDEVKADTGQLPDLVMGQEFGDRRDIKHAMVARGYGIVETRDPGSSSTPLFYLLATMVLVDSAWARLLGRVFGGRGAGPSWLKPKGLNVGHLRHKRSGRRVRASSIHEPASMQHPRRWALGQKMLNGAIAVFQPWRIIQLLGGDFNSKVEQYREIVIAMTQAGWTSSDLEGGKLNTHAFHLYDQIWWRVTVLLAFVRHFVTRFGSDHLAKTAVFSVALTRRKARSARRRAVAR